MKTLRLLVLLAALIFAGVAAPARVRADDEGAVSFDFFYDSLAPYGEWVQVGDYGLCWRPSNVDPDWTPYSDGYWAYTDAGWTWVSYEEFGGIVYHYGRWIHLDDDSWCWTPGYEWAPAWVSWRSSDDYVGWAPLPPEARWAQDTGISVWVDSVCDIGPGYYNFCRVRDFGAPVLRGVLCRRSDNIVIIRDTVNVTNITYNTTYVGGPVIFNGGPRFDVLSRVVERPIPALKLVENARFADRRGPGGRLAFNAQTVGNELIVGAPRVLRPTDPAAFRARAKRVLPAESVTKGWDMVKSPDVRRDLRAQMDRQAKGLTPQTAPAHKMVASELNVLPPKADPHAPSPTADRHEHNGAGQRPESVSGQPGGVPNNVPSSRSVEAAPRGPSTPSGAPGAPESAFRDHSHANVPPTNAPGGNGLLKPFNPNAETQPGRGPQNAPSANVPNTPGGSKSSPPIGRERSNEAVQQQPPQQQERSAEMAKERAEQERAVQQKRAEMATQQQQQAAQQEAARAQQEERRRQSVEQQPQRPPQTREPQPQPQDQRNNDPRKAQEAERDRERERPQPEPQRNEQRAPQPSQSPGSPHPNGGHSSKDGKDKDKDKDKNGN